MVFDICDIHTVVKFAETTSEVHNIVLNSDDIFETSTARNSGWISFKHLEQKFTIPNYQKSTIFQMYVKLKSYFNIFFLNKALFSVRKKFNAMVSNLKLTNSSDVSTLTLQRLAI